MQGLLAWFDAHGRDLPWRRDRDPYRVLVSEVMLQQTRVETVLGRYEAWFARFPTVHDLAAAGDDAVMAAWSGLGYYRRARNLHAAASAISEGGWPTDLAGLRALPGVGEYTAAALASILLGKPTPAIDGNLQRVVARVHDIALDVTTAAGRRAIRDAAQALIDPDRPGDWNQAMMDLGATVCVPKPHCLECPVTCLARERGTVASRPVKAARKPPVHESMHFAFVERDGRLLLAKREGGLLAGTWGLPGGSTERPLEALVQEQTGVTITSAPANVEVKHTFTHRVWSMQVFRAEAKTTSPGAWHLIDGLADVGLSTAARKAIAAAQRM